MQHLDCKQSKPICGRTLLCFEKCYHIHCKCLEQGEFRSTSGVYQQKITLLFLQFTSFTGDASVNAFKEA